eukprot:TRINITY_DN34083_c0_g1_i1.p1 TRINITY_DN34083_c0_g1~~TRINITY_DN34083_c0_g1_i1.p1  ORF type:complete len:1357 (-),score=345.87 TRINITY_DN34083_c0_g1_i1:52-4122(-)
MSARVGRSMSMASTGEEVTSETILVGLRLRPPIPREKGQRRIVTVECTGRPGDEGIVHVEPAGKVEKDLRFQIDAPMDSTDRTSANFTSQERVFEIFGLRMVDHALSGYNSAIFAYGQTGTGKTTTIMGDAQPPEERGLLPRVIYELFARRASISASGGEVICEMQMLEVYNETLRDLLAPHMPSNPRGPGSFDKPEKKPKPEVHVHPQLGVYVKEATDSAIESAEEALNLIEYGNTMKTIAATAMNHQSSRAHTIVRLRMQTRTKDNGSVAECKMSDVYVVDLAGRENEKTTLVTGDRLAELSFINRSLMWLSKCIQDLGGGNELVPPASPRAVSRDVGQPMTATKTMPSAAFAAASSSANGKAKDMSKRQTLKEGGKDAKPKAKPVLGRQQTLAVPGGHGGSGGEHPPDVKKPAKPATQATASSLAKFRNSKLTLLLSNALTGNSRTAMIATASPALSNYEETVSTLNFAATVKNIKLQAKVASTINKDDLVKSLQEEVQQLKIELSKDRRAASEIGGGSVTDCEPSTKIAELQDRLEAAEALAKRHAMSVHEMRQMSKAAKVARDKALRQLGSSATGCLVPFLANISDDPHLDGRLVFHIPAEQQDFSIGSSEDCDVCIAGLGICRCSCLLHNDGGTLYVQAGRNDENDGPSPLSVNGVDVGEEKQLLEHDDVLEIGFAYRLRVHADPSSSNRKGEWSSAMRRSSTYSVCNSGRERTLSYGRVLVPQELLAAVIGNRRILDAEQIKMAQEYYMLAQSRARKKFGGSSHLRAYVLNAQRVRKLVDEANAITDKLKHRQGIYFELSADAPVLGFGYGAQEIPEFSVRVMRRLPRAQVLWSIVRRHVFRRSVGLMDAVMQHMHMGMGGARADSVALYLWTYQKFEARLQMMRTAYEEWFEDPSSFSLPAFDPWSEHSPGEIKELEEGHQRQLCSALEDLQSRNSEISRLRDDREMLEKEVSRLRAQLASQEAYARAQQAAAVAQTPHPSVLAAAPAAAARGAATTGEQPRNSGMAVAAGGNVAPRQSQLARQLIAELQESKGGAVEEVQRVEVVEAAANLDPPAANEEWQRLVAKSEQMAESIAALQSVCKREIQQKHNAIDFAMEQLGKINAAHETMQRNLHERGDRSVNESLVRSDVGDDIAGAFAAPLPQAPLSARAGARVVSPQALRPGPAAPSVIVWNGAVAAERGVQTPVQPMLRDGSRLVTGGIDGSVRSTGTSVTVGSHLVAGPMSYTPAPALTPPPFGLQPPSSYRWDRPLGDPAVMMSSRTSIGVATRQPGVVNVRTTSPGQRRFFSGVTNGCSPAPERPQSPRFVPMPAGVPQEPVVGFPPQPMVSPRTSVGASTRRPTQRMAAI